MFLEQYMVTWWLVSDSFGKETLISIGGKKRICLISQHLILMYFKRESVVKTKYLSSLWGFSPFTYWSSRFTKKRIVKSYLKVISHGGRQRRDYYFQMHYVVGTMCFLKGEQKPGNYVRKEEEKEWRKKSTILGVK